MKQATEKKIEDYLHLYLGCECQFAVFVPGQETAGIEQRIDARVIHNVLNNLGTAKPILRPLSDMTEEEQKQLCLKMFPDCKEVKKIFEQTLSDGYGWSFECERGYRHYVSNFSYIPEAFLYMLSKGFDLFDLIDAGLAVDKTKT